MSRILHIADFREWQTTVSRKVAVYRALSVVVFSLIGCIVKGQPIYFEILDDYESWTERSTNTILLNDSIYWCDAGFDFAFGGGTHLSFLKINHEGEVLRKVTHAHPEGRFETGHITALGDTGILCLTSFKPEGENWYDLRLTAFDTAGNILWEQIYADPGFTETAYDVKKVSGGYLLVGQRYDDLDGDIVAVKVDDTGNFLWRKTYGGSSYESGNSFAETPDGGFLILGWTRSFGAGQRDWFLVKVNQDGNQQWIETYGNQNNQSGSTILESSNTSYIMFGGSGDGNGRILKVNASGDIVWLNDYSHPEGTSNYLFSGVELSDSKIIAVGGTNNPLNGDAGWLVKTSASGDLVWQRRYDYSPSTDLFYDVLATNDGGFLLSGQAINEDNFTQDAWLLKVDSIGCPYPNCTVGIDEHEKMVLVDVWPNPATDVLNIEKVGTSKQLDISVFDMNGKLVHSFTQTNTREVIDISAWSTGVHVLQGTDEEDRSFSIKVIKE